MTARARWMGAIAAVAVLGLAGCDDGAPSVAVAGGDPDRGAVAIGAYGCGTCHVIPGIPGARSLVGPPLNHLGRQIYIAGIVPNTPEALTTWIVDPPAMDPRTAMPDLGVSEREARDIAAYLYKAGR